MQYEEVCPGEQNLERALSYLKDSLPREELQHFLEKARPLASSLARFDTSALEQFYGLIGTTLYHQLRRVRNAPLEAYLVFADCYALVDAREEEKRILVGKGIREYREQMDLKEDIWRTLRE